MSKATVRFRLNQPEAPFLSDLAMQYASVQSKEYADAMLKAGTPEKLDQEPVDGGTRFTHAEHGVFFDRFWADGPNRERGTVGLLDALGLHLSRRS